jgi:hypothetical protein
VILTKKAYWQNMALPDFEQIQTIQMNKNAIVQVETAQLPHIVCLTSFYNLTPPSGG